jgi:hypothetical protein
VLLCTVQCLIRPLLLLRLLLRPPNQAAYRVAVRHHRIALGTAAAS